MMRQLMTAKIAVARTNPKIDFRGICGCRWRLPSALQPVVVDGEPTTVAISTASSEAACELGAARGHGSSPGLHDTPSNVLASRYDSRPSTPYSRPTPDCLNPPNGAKGSCCSVLIITRPACSLVATAFARAGSDDMT